MSALDHIAAAIHAANSSGDAPGAHPLGPDFVAAMNALHKIMADSPDPQVVQTVSTCLAALAKLQSGAFEARNAQSKARQVYGMIGGH